MEAGAASMLVPVRIEDWTLFAADGGHWIRDLDLADRACLASPRDIRRTIQTALADQLVASWDSGGSAPAIGTPVIRAVKVLVPAGAHGGMQEVTEYYLLEEAALLILTRLRTSAAIAATKCVVKVYMAVVRGEVRPSAPVVLGEWSSEGIALKKAVLLHQMAEAMSPAVSLEARDAMRANAAVMLTGGSIAPLLPALPAGRWRRPSEMASEFGVSEQKVGRAITKLGYRGQEQHRKGVMDTKKNGVGQVECSMWDETVYQALKRHFGRAEAA